MTLRYVFVDEAGNLDFSPQGTRYFTLTSIVLDACDVGQELAQLRRDLVRQGTDLREGFHATEDRQAVRDEVFRLLARHEFRIDATIFDKPKTMPHLRDDEVSFFKTAWFYHMAYLLPRIAAPGDEVFVVGATLSLSVGNSRFTRPSPKSLGPPLARSPSRRRHGPRHRSRACKSRTIAAGPSNASGSVTILDRTS